MTLIITPNTTKNHKPKRREHIVPRMLLARFADPSGVLWVYTKGKPARPSIPANECIERDFYEYELSGRKTNNQYEDWLARVEGNASAVLQRLIDRVNLEQSEAVIWATFVASLFARTRKVRTQISAAMVRKFGEQVQDPEFVRNMQHELLQQGEFRTAAELRESLERTRKAMDDSPSFYHVSGLPRHTITLANALLEKRWWTIDAPPGKSFLISDCPVMTSELDGPDGRRILPGAGFGKENTAVLLPIASGKLFVASPHNRHWQRVAEPRGVDNVNRQQVWFGHRNVYAEVNSPGIQLFVDAELNHVVFGQNAFLPGGKS
jgi:hypothetical protein